MAGGNKNKGGRPGLVWVLDPHSGGVTPSPAVKAATEQRLRAHAETRYPGRCQQLDIRFRGPLCYVSAQLVGEDVPTKLCRLRHFEANRWSVAFFAYSSESYQPSILPNGTFFGTPEEGLDVAAIYLS